MLVKFKISRIRTEGCNRYLLIGNNFSSVLGYSDKDLKHGSCHNFEVEDGKIVDWNRSTFDSVEMLEGTIPRTIVEIYFGPDELLF